MPSSAQAVYQPKVIESEVQQFWAENNSFQAVEDTSQEKYYCLVMLPYPSGSLHIGHVRNYAIGDAIAHFQRLLGKNVLNPIGWDAFGLPAENAAIEKGMQASVWTRKNIADMRSQMLRLGLSYDWSREVASCDEDYYKHEQAMFVEWVKKGLAFKQMAYVNWDPVQHTVLANEQVVNGFGWRSGVKVEKRKIEQWFFKSTQYLDELLEAIENRLEGWPSQVKVLQKEWIGKSQGHLLEFALTDQSVQTLFSFDGGISHFQTFTTRLDTVFGTTFLTISPDHPICRHLAEHDSELSQFLSKCDDLKRQDEDNQSKQSHLNKAKIGFKLNLEVTHPLTGEVLPVWVANYVLMEYGTGVVMVVPAHDERDFEFATQYQLPIKRVIVPKGGESEKDKVMESAQSDYGFLVNSNAFDGLSSEQAKEQISQELVRQGSGNPQTNYRMHDWGVSRQRYWGCPIPILYDEDGQITTVNPQNLPVKLPLDVAFEGYNSPLVNDESFLKAHQDGKTFKRETDTFDTFVESSWYFLRYCCPDAKGVIDERVKYWMPVDYYIGGIEHATMHLIYARVFMRMMRDIGILDYDEPFTRLLCQGMVVGKCYYREIEVNGTTKKQYFSPDELDFTLDEKGDIQQVVWQKDGEEVQVSQNNVKLSKSKKNGKNPLDLLDQYGADSLRLSLLFSAPPAKSLIWQEGNLDGSFRFIKRVWSATYQLVERAEKTSFDLNHSSFSIDDYTNEEAIVALYTKLQQTISKNTELMEQTSLNVVVASLMELFNAYQGFVQKVDRENLAFQQKVLADLILMLYPFCPHACHHLYEKLGLGVIVEQKFKRLWPSADERFVQLENLELVVQINGKVRAKAMVNQSLEDGDLFETAIKLEGVKKWTDGKTIVKQFIINQAERKLVNLVVKPS